MSEGSRWLVVGVLVPGALVSLAAWFASRQQDRRATGTPDHDPALEHLSAITGRATVALRPCRGQVLRFTGERWDVVDEFPAAIRMEDHRVIVGALYLHSVTVDGLFMVQIVRPEAAEGVPARRADVLAVAVTPQHRPTATTLHFDAIDLS